MQKRRRGESKNRIVIVAILIAALQAAGTLPFAVALEWPLPGSFMSANFGMSSRGDVSLGVTFDAPGQQIRSVGGGEVLFFSESRSLPNGFPLSGGSMLVVSHPQELVSVTTGFMPGSVSPFLRMVKDGDSLGIAGDGGVSFHLIDRLKRRFVNPAVLLPPVADAKGPIIKSLRVIPSGAGPGGESTVLGETKYLKQGSYEVIADVWDVYRESSAFAPYDLRLVVDGSQKARYVLDSAWSDSGKLHFSAEGETALANPFRIEDKMSFGSVELKRGRVMITVSAKDYTGNARDATYTVLIE